MTENYEHCMRHCTMDFCPGLELQSVIVLYRNRAQTKKFGTLLSSLKDTLPL